MHNSVRENTEYSTLFCPWSESECLWFADIPSSRTAYGLLATKPCVRELPDTCVLNQIEALIEARFTDGDQAQRFDAGQRNYSIVVHVTWELLICCHTEHADDHDIDTVLTLSGTMADAWATTCQEYVKFIWGEDGLSFLEDLKLLMTRKKAKGELRHVVKTVMGYQVR